MVSKNLTLKLATAADAGVIAVMARDLVEQGLVWSWTPQRVARHLGNRDTLTVLACDGPTIVGFAIMYMGDQHAHLNLLAVRPAYRAAGGPAISPERLTFFGVWRTLILSVWTGLARTAYDSGADRDLRLAAIGHNTFPRQLRALANDLAEAMAGQEIPA